jgi:hypothetical protein
LELDRATSRLDPADLTSRFVVTVCDRAYEEIGTESTALHWSVADPAARGGRRAFDDALAEIDRRVAILAT